MKLRPERALRRLRRRPPVVSEPMAAVDAADLSEPPEPRSDTKRRIITAVAGIAAVVLILALIRRRFRHDADDSVFDLAEESAAALAEVLVGSILPG
jgi:hypothetical protein